MKRKLPIFISYIALTFGILVCLNGCIATSQPGGIIMKSSKLRALEGSVSTVQPATGHEVDRYIEDDGSALGKPVYAEVLILYEPTDPYTKKDVFDEIVAILKKNNWESDGTTSLDHFRAFLHYDGYPVTVWVNISPDKNQVVLITEQDNAFYHFPTATSRPTPIPMGPQTLHQN